MKRALVTGGAGFVGSHVVEAYLAAGWSVTAVDDLSRGKREHLPPDVPLEVLDVRDPALRNVIAGGTFDVVNHHAAQMDVRVSVADPIFDAETNIIGLLNVLEGARAGGVRRVVFASSGGVVYGDGSPPPHREDAPKKPASPYGVSKLCSEYYLMLFTNMYGLETVALRYANVYGPRQDPHGEAGVVSIFAERLRSGHPLTLYGDGTQTRDYVYVTDVARANLLATEAPLSSSTSIDGTAFNIGTGRETSVADLAHTLAQVAQRDLQVTHALARAGELSRSALVIEKAAEEVGWTPEVELTRGLEMTYAWIVED